MPFVVALDAGTGGAKCAVYDLSGRLRALRAAAWDYAVKSDPATPYLREYSFDPARFWDLLSQCSRGALREAAVPPGEILGIAATSQREGCVFLDARGTEVYAGPNLDARGFLEGLEVLSALGTERLYEITGHAAPYIFPVARYLWFRKHDPRTVAHLLMINDWINYRLCGQPSAEPSNATESMLFDFRERRWSEEILDRLGIPAEMLPPLFSAGQRVGAVGAEAAEATGLPEGLPVIAGGADTQCALLGTGAIEDGDTAIILGTTTPIQAVVGKPTLDPAYNLWAGCHVVPDRWVLEANVGGTGDAYRWLLDLLLHGDDGDRYARAEELARQAPSAGVLAYLGPRIFDLNKLRPDMPGGVLFPFPMLQLRPEAGSLLGAFLESVAFAVRGNLTLLEAATGRRPERLLAGGGMTRNSLLRGLLADVTGLPVECSREPEAASLGCAVLVAVGAGAYDDVSSAVRSMCGSRRIEPDPERRDGYEGSFARWRKIYDALDSFSL